MRCSKCGKCIEYSVCGLCHTCHLKYGALVDEEIVIVEVQKVIALNLPGFTGFSTITVRGKQAEVVQEI